MGGEFLDEVKAIDALERSIAVRLKQSGENATDADGVVGERDQRRGGAFLAD